MRIAGAPARWRITTAAIAAGLLFPWALGGPSATAANSDEADPPDVIAPLVWISEAPSSMLRTRKARKRVRFVFQSDDPEATFTCRVDGGSFEPCTSPLTLRLKAGSRRRGDRHTFVVRAADSAGNSSGEAVRSLRIAERKKPKDSGRGRGGRR